jgi:hypothetical protein
MVRFVLNFDIETEKVLMTNSKSKTSTGPVKLASQAAPEVVSEIREHPAQPTKSLKELTLSVFKGAPNREFTGDDVLAILKRRHPTINENAVRFMLTELKRTPTDADNVQIGDALIHEVRRQDRKSVLKYGKHPQRLFPASVVARKGAKLDEEVKNKPVAGGAEVAQSDPAILEDALATIAKLQALVQRNSRALEQIQKLRAVL